MTDTKTKLATAAMFGALVLYGTFQSERISRLEEAMKGPDNWQRGISQVYQSEEWGAPRKHHGEHLMTLMESGCELHRTKWRGVYYMMNTCGGIAPEFQGLNTSSLYVPERTGAVSTEKFGENL